MEKEELINFSHTHPIISQKGITSSSQAPPLRLVNGILKTDLMKPITKEHA